MGHVCLLGDSIFDNAAYVGGQPSVLEHLRQALPRVMVKLRDVSRMKLRPFK